MFDYTAVITSYNSENTISDALNSISQQEIMPSEVILVDDNSVDNTVAIARSFENLLPNLQVIANLKNEGQSAGRNKASRAARSKYLIFFDDDDIALPTRSSKHGRDLNSGSVISFVSSLKLYPNNYTVCCINSDLSSIPAIEEFTEMLLLGKTRGSTPDVFVPASTCAVSLSHFREVSGFDEKLRRLEDVDLALKFALHGFRFSWTSEMGVTRRYSANNSKGGGIDMEYERILLTKYREILGTKNFENALTHVEARQLYFSHKYFKFILHAFLHPIYTIKTLPKLRRFVDRVKHDVKRIL